MGEGKDFFETTVGLLTMRCDVLLGNVDLWVAGSGEVLACYAGIADVRAGLKHWGSVEGGRAADMRALLDTAVIAITAEEGARVEA